MWKKDVERKNTSKNNQNFRIYDYDFDSDLIWGAFYEQFRIDLTTARLHWWKFRAMWVSINKNSQFSIIRGYRSYTGKDKELLKLKEQYKLPKTQFEIDEEKRHKKIFNQLNKLSNKKEE